MAKTVDVTVAHRLTLEDAKERIQALGDYYASKYGATVSWQADEARVLGAWMLVKLDVSVAVSPSTVRLVAPDPGRLLRKRMLGYVRRKLRAYLDPSSAVADLARG